ncbi:MAG: nuclear transport factor 2 family protein [Flavobacteriales bacterium]|nr:nuclear transport factor 2 family protein [Flavobacteriales bacterium]
MKSIVLFALLISTTSAWSQNDSIERSEVRAVIDQLFEGMLKGDSTLVRSVFHPSARAYTSYKKGDEFVLMEESVDKFVAAVGTPHDKIWDERISNVVIQVDDGLAQVWMDYSFYLGETFSHKGVNAMQLAKSNGHWQIIQIADTRKRE